MAVNQKRLQAALRNYDIVADKSWDQLGKRVAELLKTKTYCVINADWKPGTLEAAQRQARELRKTNSQVQILPEEITDGLLGREGSHKTLQLGDGVLPKDSMLDRMQVEMFRIADSLKKWFPPAQGPHEGMDPILNISGVPEATPVPLTEKLVKDWRNIYIRQSLLILICLGPRDGILEITALGETEEEENTVEVAAQAGSIIVLKPEFIWHTLKSPSKTMVLSCFWLAASNQYYRINYHYLNLPPTAEVLDEWMFLRLKELKDMEDEEDHGKTWGAMDNPDIPRDWQNMMNHLFFKGHMMSVIGITARVPPNDYTFEEWFRGQSMATDTATVAPLTRWDSYRGMTNGPGGGGQHSVYASFDPAPDSWMDMKVYCRHGCFMDDIHLFDEKKFGIGSAEARVMDPHQRQVMEVAYETLLNAGISKKEIMDKNCGVYVGMMQESQWVYVERMFSPAEDKVHQATAIAASIASNRVSFCLGMKGASLTLDVESASGLCAVYNASASLEPRGRARPADAALALSAHLLLSRQMWPQYCATKLLSAEGRCFAFSDDADGYILADAVAGLMLKLEHGDADGTNVDALPSDSSWSYGSVAGMAMNNNGRSAKLMGANGPAQQEVIYMAVRNASISCWDVDAVEAHATGDKMRDAIEQGSFSKMLRDEFSQDPLILSASKTLVGHSCAAGGTVAFMRALLSIRWAWIPPSLHLEIVNPNHVMADICFLGVEMVQYKLESAFVGVASFGFGGTNVAGLVWGRCWEPSDEEFPLNTEAQAQKIWV